MNEGNFKWYELLRNQDTLNTIITRAPRGLVNDSCSVLPLFVYLKDHKADTLTRVSYLIGIFKALNVLHSESLADAWVQLPNKNRLFGGQTPLSYMLRGNLPAMQSVRRLLDARRGGM